MAKPTDDDIERIRHQCEVRQVLRWRVEHGREWVRDWLAGVAKRRGHGAADRLDADAREQWTRGNRGAVSDWRQEG
jgi:hypothetical protein